MADERDPRNRYRDRNERNEEAVEEEQDEEAYEEVEEGGKGALTGFLILFIILFVLSTGLLVYFQFYQGNGEWKLTFKHKNAQEQPVEELKKENKGLKSEIKALEEEHEQTKANLEEARKKAEQTSSGQSKIGGADISGKYYEVQIGAFKSFDFNRYGNNITNLTFSTEDGVKKLSLGRFKEANAARAFRRDLTRIGLEDAFIVKKKNGKRVEIIESF